MKNIILIAFIITIGCSRKQKNEEHSLAGQVRSCYKERFSQIRNTKNYIQLYEKVSDALENWKGQEDNFTNSKIINRYELDSMIFLNRVNNKAILLVLVQNDKESSTDNVVFIRATECGDDWIFEQGRTLSYSRKEWNNGEPLSIKMLSERGYNGVINRGNQNREFIENYWFLEDADHPKCYN